MAKDWSDPRRLVICAWMAKMNRSVGYSVPICFTWLQATK